MNTKMRAVTDAMDGKSTMTHNNGTSAARVLELETALELMAALRETSRDQRELARCDEARRLLDVDRRVLLAELSADDRLWLDAARARRVG